MPLRLRSVTHLIAATVLLPLGILLLGLWEQERAGADWADLVAERRHLTRIVADLEARAPPDGRPDFRMQFRRNGKGYGGPLALVQARAARDEVATLTTVMDWRRLLPPVVVAAGGGAALLSILVLLAGAALGRLGRASRDALVAGFSWMRRLLPPVLALQVLFTTAGFVAAVVFEAGLLARPGLGGSEIKMLFVAVVAIGAVLVAAGATVLGLRRALSAFEPDPLSIFGRVVSPAEAPGLWRLIEGLGERLGALKPEAVVVGLTGGFFVSAGPAVVEPGGAPLTGRILYLPLPYLALLRGDEVAAIIGHELAHYAGGDTVYSQRFLPIYAGVGRSLDAVAEGHAGSFGLLGPSLRLGVFVMENFHLAVRHWSRTREFAADAAGASPVSVDAAARALLRTGAVAPRIAETLDAAAEAPGSAPADLVAASLDHAIARGLDDPATHLEAEQAHPTDTHPPTRERLAALGRTLDTELLAAAAAVPPPHALGQLAAYFADPTGLCRAATHDFLDAVRTRDAAFRAHLEATVAEIGTEARVLRESTRPGAIALLVAGGFFIGVALLWLAAGLPGLSASQAGAVMGVALACGAVLGGIGGFRLWRGERTTMILSPDSVAVPGLDRPIPWDSIADLDMTTRQNGVVTRLLLPPEAPFPQRVPGGRKVKLDAGRRIVTITAGLPYRMSVQDFAGLIGRYRQAAQARRVLAETAAASESSQTPVIP
ncbi:M48 family metalloprotease [Methylobacterium goesingense]|uniref:Zn-dependent protease with chaperone function n=1 Tax=Methylobacterium goesingense TaxID=243690 RepID=A0ABV2L2G1_9HYPH|nr:M48 family metallopeptidase [Methylobacterium goesingense]GJD73225.1 Protease HtpX [Methylobacterium goesingense]